ncbi:MAG: NAD(P)/FAD-dependent oxidoreductase [Thermoproteota archaeon]
MRRVVVIGAGIVGSAVARELSKYEGLELHVLEKEADVGWGASKANTGIVHAGYDDDPDKFPVRARLCRAGNDLWHRLAEELQVPVRWCGALVLAFSDGERRILAELLSRGERNGVSGLRIIDKDLFQSLERNVSKDAVEALWAPTSGIISPYEATIALIESATENGAKLHLETLAKRIVIKERRVVGVETDRGFLEADIVINASGIFGDIVSRTAGVYNFSIRPRRGEYFLFDRDASPKVAITLFPAPKPETKGVVVTQTTDGNLLVGPNAEDLAESERESNRTTREGSEEVWREASKLVEKLPPRNMAMRTFAGLRPEPNNGDFIIKAYEDPAGFVNCVGTRSPGLTSAPAIANEVVKFIEEMGIELVVKRGWKRRRSAITKFRELTTSERDSLISKDPNYGRIVCTCELVTEAEIIEAIRRGARTIDSIKFRTRAGMGRCQGSFCLSKILISLGREGGGRIEEITAKGQGSRVVLGKIRSEPEAN